MRQQTDFTVTGPGCEGRGAPAVGPALSLAQTIASRATQAGTFYVRDASGAVRYHVERDESGNVWTRAATTGPAVTPPPVAQARTLTEVLA